MLVLAMMMERQEGSRQSILLLLREGEGEVAVVERSRHVLKDDDDTPQSESHFSSTSGCQQKPTFSEKCVVYPINMSRAVC